MDRLSRYEVVQTSICSQVSIKHIKKWTSHENFCSIRVCKHCFPSSAVLIRTTPLQPVMSYLKNIHFYLNFIRPTCFKYTQSDVRLVASTIYIVGNVSKSTQLAAYLMRYYLEMKSTYSVLFPDLHSRVCVLSVSGTWWGLESIFISTKHNEYVNVGRYNLRKLHGRILFARNPKVLYIFPSSYQWTSEKHSYFIIRNFFVSVVLEIAFT